MRRQLLRRPDPGPPDRHALARNLAEVLNTDAAVYGGSGAGNLGAVVATGHPWAGEEASALVTVGAGAVVWLAGRHPGLGAATAS